MAARLFSRMSLFLLVPMLAAVAATAQQNTRVATYNIKFLSTAVQSQGDRLAKLRDVIDLLDADVIGLQEIADRGALELIFPPQDWSIFIDNDSGNNQDEAIVVRRPFMLLGVDASLDADDQHFLFPGAEHNAEFPNRRDLLFAEIQVPNSTSTFFVIVHHAKSRFEGRAVTDPRRAAAATSMLAVLEQRFHERDFVLLGDFNDNPDDRSLNILETGNPFAPGGAEEDDGPFLVNLAESLVAAGRVSHGRNSMNILGDQVDTVDPESRTRNNDNRGNNQNTGDILFDQLLIPMRTRDRYVLGSAQVFDRAVAVRGNNQTRASDHLPVFADFVFGAPVVVEPPSAGLRIAALLPDPEGQDGGREQVTLRNTTGTAINLTGWVFRDRAQNEFALTGSVAANGSRVITMGQFTMPLNNSGDEVFLIDQHGAIRHQVQYEASQVQPGVVISLP